MMHRQSMRRRIMLWLIAAAALATLTAAQAAETKLLWEVGKRDGRNGEFALSPRGYAKYKEDGFFVAGPGAGASVKQTWPYVHPGPVDGWAGGRQHTFFVLFGLAEAPREGTCKLTLALIDTQSRSAPRLQVKINGLAFEKQLARGAGDATVYGNPGRGKKQAVTFEFPATQLKAGDNRVELTITRGSWLLYDWVGLEAPANLKLAPTALTFVDTIQAPPMLLRRGADTVQPLQVEIRHFGPPAEATVRAGNLATTHTNLANGRNVIAIPLKPVTQATTLTVAVELGGKPLATKEVGMKPVRKWEVYILPHSHVDIGYTDIQTAIEKKQHANIDKAIELARASAGNPEGARFKWNVEVLWAVESYMKQGPEYEKKLIDAVKEGLVGLDGLYANELTGLCRPEEMVRLMRYATMLRQKYGVTIDSAMISDVPGLVWGMVPTMAHAGIRYISDGVNYVDRIGYSLVKLQDKPMWWVSQSGKERVLFWTPYMGYAAAHRPFRMEIELMNRLAELEEQGYPYDMFQLRWSKGDNGPPDEPIIETVKQWNATHVYPRLVIATTSEMFHEFEKRYGDKLPTQRGDFTPYWEDGAASSAHETVANRQVADLLNQTETLWAMLAPAKYPAADFWQAWRNVVLYDEHTWGANISVSKPDSPFTMAQWKIKQAFALDGAKQSLQLYNAAITATGGQIRPESSQSVDVTNTSSWPRSDLMYLAPRQSTAGDRVVNEEGEAVPAQRIAAGQLAFIARNVPPFATRRYTVKSGKAEAAGKAYARGNEIGNDILKIRIDEKTGAIAELRCKGIAGNLVDAKSGTALNEYFYLIGGDLKDLQRAGTPKITVKDAGSLVASIWIQSVAPGCRGLTRIISVVDGSDRVEITNIVDKLAVRQKEGIHFGFGFNVPDGQVRLDVPWSVVRPDADQIPAACKNWYSVQRWVDVSNDRYGVTWATPDAPLVEVGGITANLPDTQPNPEVWRKQVGPAQSVYSWAMNNHWHTNYRAEQEGPTTFRYVIRPHTGGFNETEATRFGIECAQRMLGGYYVLHTPPSQSRLKVAPASVLVSAFKPSDDGKAWIVRLFNASDKEAPATVTFADPQPKAVTLSEIDEAPGTKLTGPVPIPPHDFVTLRAELP